MSVYTDAMRWCEERDEWHEIASELAAALDGARELSMRAADALVRYDEAEARAGARG